MLFIKSLFFFAVAVSSAAIGRDVLDEPVASLARRDSAQTQADMEAILENINALTNSTGMYNGTPATALRIVMNHQELLQSINTATEHAKNTTVPSEQDSAAIISFIGDKMFKAMGETLSVIKSKKSYFVDAGQAKAMRSVLDNLEFVTLKLSGALVDATPLSKTLWALSVSKDMQSEFDKAIAVYSD
ncbi:hypothetical protein E4U13_002504 [Claviceps humidiphila]|uniref:Cell wall galactomannoprotein n=1 Tax=Claviceps humidiphila TaxID=1294629 RepID=A0A9P7QBN2_9HYPO|nr:hypothetical protein E4U13_002504 [Claviceps humidiphila]